VRYGKSKEGREGGEEDAREGKGSKVQMRRVQVRPNRQTLSMIDALQKIHNDTRNEEKSSWSR